MLPSHTLTLLALMMPPYLILAIVILVTLYRCAAKSKKDNDFPLEEVKSPKPPSTDDGFCNDESLDDPGIYHFKKKVSVSTPSMGSVFSIGGVSIMTPQSCYSPAGVHPKLVPGALSSRRASLPPSVLAISAAASRRASLPSPCPVSNKLKSQCDAARYHSPAMSERSLLTKQRRLEPSSAKYLQSSTLSPASTPSGRYSLAPVNRIRLARPRRLSLPRMGSVVSSEDLTLAPLGTLNVTPSGRPSLPSLHRISLTSRPSSVRSSLVSNVTLNRTSMTFNSGTSIFSNDDSSTVISQADWSWLDHPLESFELQSKQTMPEDTAEIPTYIDPGFWV